MLLDYYIALIEKTIYGTIIIFKSHDSHHHADEKQWLRFGFGIGEKRKDPRLQIGSNHFWRNQPLQSANAIYLFQQTDIFSFIFEVNWCSKRI